eukprot:GHUV01012878.1.p1 GENE.GHUV01012878.1~~GHUV01012878.1.p1  ORF type:complete len:266 (+),score=62.65 GHUV01012878.1:277-1074(+)
MPYITWHHVLAALALAAHTAAARHTGVAAYLKQQEQDPCEPWTVEPEDRCSYVIEHAGACYPDGGWQSYLRYHYCNFEHWQWVSVAILVSGILFSFGVLLTISERFFCPALELISEYLQLAPVVAGATLLAFGNGAPDIFTQVAAVGQVNSLRTAIRRAPSTVAGTVGTFGPHVEASRAFYVVSNLLYATAAVSSVPRACKRDNHTSSPYLRMQGDTPAVGMALAEPMGGGLFTTNIVFGVVVMLGAAARVSWQVSWLTSAQTAV